MKLNLTLPGFGGSKKAAPDPEPQAVVKRRYWTPDPNDVTLYKGDPGYQGDAPEGYSENDAWYKNKVYDKKTGEWIKASDDIYKVDKETGEQVYWQAPSQPQKKGLLK